MRVRILCKSSPVKELNLRSSLVSRRLGVYSFNERAVRLYERIGFVREGVCREAYYYDYKWHDRILYSILEKEWDVIRSSEDKATSASILLGKFTEYS